MQTAFEADAFQNNAFQIAAAAGAGRVLLSRWRADAPASRWRADTAPRSRWSPAVAVQDDKSIFQGEDISWLFAPASPGGPVTNWTLQFNIKASPGGAVQYTATPTITDGPNGIITVTLPSATTAALAGGVYWYELRRIDSGATSQLTTGNLTVLAR